MLSPAPGTPSLVDGQYMESVLINKEAPESIVTTLSAEKTSAELTIELPKRGEEYTPTLKEAGLENIVAKYAQFKHLKRTDYTLLPSTHYTLTASSIAAGTSTATITAEIKDYESLPYGVYLLPVVVEDAGKEYIHLISLNKFSMVSALSESNKKPLPRSGNRTEPMKVVAYVETNDLDPRNIANFVLKDSKKPVVDMVVLFAANMNYDAVAGRRYLSFNDKLQPIVNNPDMYIKYLKDRGIKVIIDILPNHQGVGYSNFQNYEEALAFARELKEWTDKLGIDGWDMDEEYANYPAQPQLRPKGYQSAEWYMKAMKEVMPDKLLTLYEFGFPGWGQDLSKYVDYSFADYGISGSSDYGIPNDRYFSRSFEAARASSGWYFGNLANDAQSNVSSGYAGQMLFGIQPKSIKNGKATEWFTSVSRVFYNEDTIFEGPYFAGPNEQ